MADREISLIRAIFLARWAKSLSKVVRNVIFMMITYLAIISQDRGFVKSWGQDITFFFGGEDFSQGCLELEQGV